MRVKCADVTGGGSTGSVAVCKLLWEASRTHFREEPAPRPSDVFPTLAAGEIIGSGEASVTLLSCDSWLAFTLSSHWVAGCLVGAKS